MKILHFSDVHCRDHDIKEIEKCLNFIVKRAQEEQPDIIIFAGDLFDAAGIRADSLSAKLAFKIFKELADIAPIAAIIGTPSHDSDTASILKYIKARYPVKVSTHPEQLYLCEGDLESDPAKLSCPDQAPIEAVISLCLAPTKQHFKTDSDIKTSDAEIASELSKVFLGFAAQAAEYDCPQILVLHCTIRGAAISDTQVMTGRDIEIGKDQVEMSGCDICLCGHLHYPQRIHNSNIFYSGSIVSLNWGEIHDHGFYIHELEGKKLIESRFIQTPSTKLIKLSEDLTGAGDLADTTGLPLMDILLSSKAFSDVQDAKVKVELKVFQDEAKKINTEELKEAFLAKGAKEVDVQLVRIPREATRSQKILQLTSLRDKLIEMAALRNEIVPKSILLKADMLESEESDKIISEVTNAA